MLPFNMSMCTSFICKVEVRFYENILTIYGISSQIYESRALNLAWLYVHG